MRKRGYMEVNIAILLLEGIPREKEPDVAFGNFSLTFDGSGNIVTPVVFG